MQFANVTDEQGERDEKRVGALRDGERGTPQVWGLSAPITRVRVEFV